ncbi:MAG: DNA recombination protein RmuC [bacterium]|nr:DNA recombination protein RmuC [bacterium]
MEIALFIAIILLALLVLWQNSKIQKIANENQNEAALNLLKTDLVEMNKSLISMREGFGENLADFNEKMNSKIDKNNFEIRNSLEKQLSESSKIVSEVSNRLTKLDQTNHRVISVADELKTLQNVLQNPKQRGVFGEFYLTQVLENILPPNAFQLQYKFQNNEAVDAVIFLDQNKILPIDSKFSLENYNRMIEAQGEERKVLAKKVQADLKARIDETAKYIRPDENTMDFAFMFIPSESLYYDMLVGKVGEGGSQRDLVEYAFRDKRVIVVSPTSFMAYLQTVLQGLKSLQIEEQSKEIQKRVAQLKTHITKYEESMTKLGKSLGTTVNHFNSAHQELGKIDKDVVRISGEENRTGVLAEKISKPELD